MLYVVRLACLPLLCAAALAQPPAERFLATFKERSFDLETYRAAILARRPASEIAHIVVDLERRARADQAAFGDFLTTLGGRIATSWWIVNGCVIEIDADRLDAVRAHPRVASLERDAFTAPAARSPIKDSTNANNHAVDALQAIGIKGQGVGVAIMDSGQDANMGGTNRPHATYFVNGDIQNTTGGGIAGSRLRANVQIGLMSADDVTGHGTGTAAIAAGEKWSSHASADRGHAPLASIVGYAIADDAQANTLYSTMISAWQRIAADRALYALVVANNSYLGAPSPLHASQQALDSVAYNADVLVTVAGGNFGSVSAQSQSCANGLAVGATHTDTREVAEFSSRGPLAGDPDRSYPDLVANGVLIVMPQRDNETPGVSYIAAGTSFAAPQVCGAAALFRSVRTTATALETKAALLATTEDISGKNLAYPLNTKNAYGAGYLRDDRLLALAQGGGVVLSDSVTAATTKRSYSLPVQQDRWYSVVVTWPRVAFASSAWSNLDLVVRQLGVPLATSATPRNLWEKTVFRASATGQAQIEVEAKSLEAASIPFALVAVDSPPPYVHGAALAYGQGCAGSGFVYTIPTTGPGGFSNKFGNAAADHPIGPWDHRLQVVIDRAAMPFAVAINGVALRQDELEWNESKPYSFELEVEMGDSPNAPSALSTTFQSNVNGTPTKVFQRRRLDIVPPPAPNTSPSNWTFRLPYDTQFVWVPLPGRHLLWQCAHYNNAPAATDQYAYKVDAELDTSATPMLASVLGSSPTSTTGTLRPGFAPVFGWMLLGAPGAAPALQSSDVPRIGAGYRVDISQGAPSAAASLLLGLSRTAWGSVPLPFDLSFLGAPGCSILAEGRILVPLQLNPAGATSLVLQVPLVQAVIGGSLFHQLAAIDPNANALGLSWSHGLEVVLGGQL